MYIQIERKNDRSKVADKSQKVKMIALTQGNGIKSDCSKNKVSGVLESRAINSNPKNNIVQCVVNNGILDGAIAQSAREYIDAAPNAQRRAYRETWRSHNASRGHVLDRARAILIGQGIDMGPQSEYTLALMANILEEPTVFN
ncbi:hypothetical protein [Vibrio cionasavignyae]|uniref:hypothetical protein n=1 Tax=Vibrio cionasavignyae TaxID=2910252 RepID=UPI003D0D3BE4